MKNSLLLLLLVILTSVRVFGQCTLSVSVTSSSPNICSGSNVLLTASVSGGTGPYSYTWSTGDITATASVNKAGTYTVTVSDKTPGCPGVKKSITLGSVAAPAPPTVASVAACPNSPATLTATAPGGTYQWYDAATGGNFLATGASYTTPPITATTTYYVETTVNGCTSSRTAVVVTLLSNPTVIGASICAGNTAILQASHADSYTWYDAASGGNVVGTGSSFVTPVLFVNTTYYLQGVTNGCTSPRLPVTVVVTPAPAAPTASGATICSGGSVTLHAIGSGTIDWFNTPTGGTSLISSPDFTTPPLSATTTYYVQSTLNTCQSARTPVTVTVNMPPSPPVVAPQTTCSGGTVTLTPTGPGGTYEWYNAQNGGTLLFTGPSFTTPPLAGSTVYYVQVTNGCTSTRTAVAVTVSPTLASPSASGAIICPGSSATLTATAPGGTYQWYDAPTGGTLLATNASFTTPALNASTTYYVQTTIGSCVSPRTPVTVSLLPAPVAPTAPGTTICSGNIATLTVTSPSGNYAWYDAASGGNLLGNGSVYVTPALAASTTYYVENISAGGCSSARTAVTITVTPIPSAPVINPVPALCPGSQATLIATGTTGTVTWYDAATGGNILGTGNSFTTPVLNTTTTFYADQTTGACPSSRTSVTVAVTSVANPQFQYSSGTYCTGAANPTPIINNSSGGTFSASPAGLVFVSTATGQINIGASTQGTYTVTFAGNGACPTFTTTTIVITATPNAQFSYSGPICENANPVLPVFPAGASAGTFTASPAGLIFADKNTGQIVPQSSAPGTYTVTNTIPASGTCALTTFSTTVTIDPSVVVTAGVNQTVPAGTPVTLSGSITGGTTTGTWSGGTGSFSNPNALNAVYTPGAGETTATLTLTSTDPPGSCGPKSNHVTITYTPIPAAPTATGVTICSGNAATLTATAPGGSYAWYDAATGGNQLATGPNFTTPALLVNTTYYVQTTVNGATGPRTAVTVTINAMPPAPTASPGSTCYGNPATLTATGSAGSYEWYDAPTGGNLVSTSNTYTTTVLTTNTSYYVQSVVNGCPSSRTKVDVTVNPVPNVTSTKLINICSGTAFNYTITADVPGTTFTWSRPAVIGISNPAVTNQTTSTISETLINTTNTLINAIYTITPTVNGCTGAPFRFIVTVNPPPSVSSPAAVTVCSGTPLAYNITFNNPNGVTFTWSRAAVPGISNAPLTGQASGTILETLVNTTNAPVNVTYVINYQSPTTCPTPPFNLVVTVTPYALVNSASSGTACTGVAQNYSITSNVAGATFSWGRAAVVGVSNTAINSQTSATITEALDNTTTSPVIVTYIITPMVSGCPGQAFAYKVTVYPDVPTPVANSNSPVCSGTSINLQSPTIPNATYNWSGPNGFTSNLQNPTINNITVANAGTYSLFITINGCNSATVTTDVVVDPLPVAAAQPVPVQCTNVTSVPITGTVTGGTTKGIWSTGGTGTFGSAPNVLTNTYLPSAQDIANGSVVLTLVSASQDNCNLSSSSITIAFKSPSITSGATGSVCSGTALSYTITSDSPVATFTWGRAVVPGISNSAASNQTSSTITETLINTTNQSIAVPYIITPIAAGCPGTPFTYTVTVNPIPQAPVITSNSPVCVNTDINLQTPTVAGATYSWMGPNGYTSAQQNPSITNVTAVNAGTYSLTITENGCPSPAGSVNVIIDPLPTVDVGPNTTITICPSMASVQLAGSVGGGATGGTWTTNGTGTFSGGGSSTTVLNGQYFPSAQDVTNGSVTLTLASTSNDNCAIATAPLTIKIQLLKAVTAGPDQTICSQDNASLAGQITIPGGGIWTTSGTGTFNPSASQLNAAYVPSAQDIKNGSVVLALTANGAGTCYIPTDKLTITFAPPPTVSAGRTVYVLKGRTVTLSPTVSDPNVTYSWSPNVDISSTTVENPVVTGNIDETYTLTVTDSRGCTATSSVKVIVSPPIVIPNTFTPNGDGVNDQWNITGLSAYQQATVDVFDRNGQKIFHSVGYGAPWDGTYNGKQVPYGVYYYVINPNFSGLQILSGSVTVIR